MWCCGPSIPIREAVGSGRPVDMKRPPPPVGKVTGAAKNLWVYGI